MIEISFLIFKSIRSRNRIEKKYNNLYHSLDLNIAGKFGPLSFSKNRIATFKAIIANSVNYPPALEEENAFSNG